MGAVKNGKLQPALLSWCLSQIVFTFWRETDEQNIFTRFWAAWACRWHKKLQAPARWNTGRNWASELFNTAEILLSALVSVPQLPQKQRKSLKERRFKYSQSTNLSFRTYRSYSIKIWHVEKLEAQLLCCKWIPGMILLFRVPTLRSDKSE